MEKKIIYSLLLLSLFGCTSLKKSKIVNEVKFSDDVSISEYKLANGLTVLLVPNKSAPLTTVNHWVKAGSLHERKGITGIAHLFEHMMFRPLEGEKLGIRGKAAEYGGSVGANTRFGATFYQSSVPHQNLKLLLRDESHRFRNLKVNDKTLNVERKAVWSEYSTKMDSSPVVDLWLNTYYKGYVNHPYEWMIIGARSDLEKINAKDCNSFFEKYYRPNNIGLVVSGNFNKHSVIKMIEKYYGSWEAGVKTTTPPFYKNRKGYVRAVGKLKSKVKYVMIAHRIPEPTSENFDVMELANFILYNSSFSIARREIQIKKKMVSDIDDFNFHYDRGTIKGFATLDKKYSVNSLVKEIGKLKKVIRNMSLKEFNAYKKAYQIKYSEEMLRNSGLADWVSLSWGKYGSYQKLVDMRNNGLKVSKDELNFFLDRYYTKDNLIVVTNKNQE